LFVLARRTIAVSGRCAQSLNSRSCCEKKPVRAVITVANAPKDAM
jgi:hypothetical protein